MSKKDYNSIQLNSRSIEDLEKELEATTDLKKAFGLWAKILIKQKITLSDKFMSAFDKYPDIVEEVFVEVMTNNEFYTEGIDFKEKFPDITTSEIRELKDFCEKYLLPFYSFGRVPHHKPLRGLYKDLGLFNYPDIVEEIIATVLWTTDCFDGLDLTKKFPNLTSHDIKKLKRFLDIEIKPYFNFNKFKELPEYILKHERLYGLKVLIDDVNQLLED